MKKSKLFTRLALLIITAASLSWCTTFTGDIPIKSDIPDVVYISPKNGDGVQDSVNIPLSFPQKEGLEITGYSMTINDQGGTPVYTMGINKQQDKKLALPDAITWDGKNSKGEWAADGTYYLVFQAWDNSKNTGTLPQVKIMVDNENPEISVRLSPLPFTPDNNGENDQLNIYVSVSDSGTLKDWSAVITDPTGQPFINLPKNQFRNNTYVWNGRSPSGELVQSASDYTLDVSAVDMAGNKINKQETIPIDILVLKMGDKYKIVISNIYFKAYTPDFMSVDPALVKKNLATLDRLAEILKKYSAYNIRLEGHAVRTFWKDRKKGDKEEKEKLLPLSKARAEAIRDALVKRGIDKERMTVAGLGSSQPVVPHSDEINRWKNRRVEFILIKK